MATTITFSNESTFETFPVSAIDTLGSGIYLINENGRIKHHHNLVVSVDNIYYLSSFDRLIDEDLLDTLERNSNFSIETKSIKNHPSVFTDKLEYE